MLFEMRAVSVSYEQVRALSEVSLTLDKGEIVTLIGANGAGKSTVMRAITGAAGIRSGEIWFDGRRIDGLSSPVIVSLGISEVPEGRRVFPYLSVRDNLLMGAYSRTDRKAIPRDLARVYELFPVLAARRSQQGGSLSGGEQQQLALARALMARPRLLLLDEPSLGLSPLLVKEVGRMITRLNQEENLSIILVEQNARMALRIAHRGYVLELGRVALSDRSPNLIRSDYVRRLYLGG
jgi:branched-chain amino acid transport system ATP-binding protein